MSETFESVYGKHLPNPTTVSGEVERVALAMATVIAKRHGHQPEDWLNDERREEARAAIQSLRVEPPSTDYCGIVEVDPADFKVEPPLDVAGLIERLNHFLVSHHDTPDREWVDCSADQLTFGDLRGLNAHRISLQRQIAERDEVLREAREKLISVTEYEQGWRLEILYEIIDRIDSALGNEGVS